MTPKACLLVQYRHCELDPGIETGRRSPLAVPIRRPQVDFTVASLSKWLLAGSRRTIQRGRVLGSAAVAYQQDGDGHEHRVTISVEAVVAADAGKSVRGAAAADDTTRAGAEEPMHVAPVAATPVGQRAP